MHKWVRCDVEHKLGALTSGSPETDLRFGKHCIKLIALGYQHSGTFIGCLLNALVALDSHVGNLQLL
jgi:hypothetical protein